jgi:hypothetical protein
VSDTISPTSPAAESLGNNEFGEAIIDLTGAGVFPEGECVAFGKVYAVSRSSGNSAQAQMKDLVGPGDIDLQNCGSIIIRKVTDPVGDTTTDFAYTTTGGLNPATFNLKDGENQDYGAEVEAGSYSVTESDPGTDYVLTDIDCSASSTTNGSTIDIGADDNFDDGDDTISISLVGQDSIDCTFTNTLQTGAIEVTKTRKFASAETGDPNSQPHEGVTFTVTDPEDNVVASGSTDSSGKVCFDGLPLNVQYTVTETVPAGYTSDDSEKEATPTVNASCDDNPFVGSTLTFHNSPLTDLSISVASQDAGATKSTINCVDASLVSIGSSGAAADPATLDVDDLPIGTYTCTIVIDP